MNTNCHNLLNKCLLWRPSVQIIGRPEKAWLYDEHVLYDIQEQSLHRLLVDLKLMLNYQSKVLDVLDRFYDYNSDSLLELLNYLITLGVLVEATEPISGSTDAKATDLSSSDFELPNTPNLHHARVALVSLDFPGIVAGSTLVREGIGELRLIDTNDANLKTAINIIPSQSLSSQGILPDIQVDRVLLSSWNTKELKAAIKGYHLVVCVLDRPWLGQLRLVNETCLQIGIPLLPGYLWGSRGVVGPLCSLNHLACYRCLELREIGAAAEPEAEQDVRDWLAQCDSETLAQFAGTSLHAEVVAKLAATEALAFFSASQTPVTQNSVIMFDLSRLESSVHPVLKHPLCPSCGPSIVSRQRVVSSKGGTLQWNETSSTIDSYTLLRRVRRWVDPKTGLIIRASTVDRSESTCDHTIPLFESVAFTSAISHDSFRRVTGSANGITPEDAELAALVEALERYCLVVPIERRAKEVSAYEEIVDVAVYPPDLILYSERQYAQPDFPLRRFSEKDKLSWIWGQNLATGELILVPAEFISLAGPRQLVHETSSGAAGHRSFEEATLNGLYELIERDAFVITWLNQLPVPQVSLPTADGTFAADVQEILLRFGYEMRVYDLTSDIGIPILLTLAVDQTGRKQALLSGAGADIDPAMALRKGCYEVLRMLPRKRPATCPPGLTDETVRQPFDHVDLYADPAHLARLEFLKRGTHIREFSDINKISPENPIEALRWCLNHLSNKGIDDVYVVDITTQDVADLGIHVVKVFAAGLQPLHFGKRFRRLGGTRLYQAPVLWGYSSTETDENHLNPHAHFFP